MTTLESVTVCQHLRLLLHKANGDYNQAAVPFLWLYIQFICMAKRAFQTYFCPECCKILDLSPCSSKRFKNLTGVWFSLKRPRALSRMCPADLRSPSATDTHSIPHSVSRVTKGDRQPPVGVLREPSHCQILTSELAFESSHVGVHRAHIPALLPVWCLPFWRATGYLVKDGLKFLATSSFFSER